MDSQNEQALSWFQLGWKSYLLSFPSVTPKILFLINKKIFFQDLNKSGP
jgi:hypothetical protein